MQAGAIKKCIFLLLLLGGCVLVDNIAQKERQKIIPNCNIKIRIRNNSEQLKKLIKYTLPALLIPFSEILSSSRDNHNHNRNNQNCTIINASGSKSCFNNSNIISQNLQQHPQPQYPTQCDFANRMQYSQTTNPIYTQPCLGWRQSQPVVHINPQYNPNIRPCIQQQYNLPLHAMGVYPNFNVQRYIQYPQGRFSNQSQEAAYTQKFYQGQRTWFSKDPNRQQVFYTPQQPVCITNNNIYAESSTQYLQYDIPQPLQHAGRLRYQHDCKESKQFSSEVQLAHRKNPKMMLGVYRPNDIVLKSQESLTAKLITTQKQSHSQEAISNKSKKNQALQLQPKAQNQKPKKNNNYVSLITDCNKMSKMGIPRYEFNKINPHYKYIRFICECKSQLFGDTLKHMGQDYSNLIELLLLGNIEQKEELINFVFNNKNRKLRYKFDCSIKNHKKTIHNEKLIYHTDNNTIIGGWIFILGLDSAKRAFYKLGEEDYSENKPNDINRHFSKRNSKNVLSNEAFLFAKNNGLYVIKPNYQEYKYLYNLGFTYLGLDNANLYYRRGYDGMGCEGKEKTPSIDISQEKEIVKDILSGTFEVSTEKKEFTFKHRIDERDRSKYNQQKGYEHNIYYMKFIGFDGTEIELNKELPLLSQFKLSSNEITSVPLSYLLNLFKANNLVFDITIPDKFRDGEESILFDNLFIRHQNPNQSISPTKYEKIEGIRKDVLTNNLIDKELSLKKSGYMLSASPSIAILEKDELNLKEDYNRLNELGYHVTNLDDYIVKRAWEANKRLIISSEIDGIVNIIGDDHIETLSDSKVAFRGGDS